MHNKIKFKSITFFIVFVSSVVFYNCTGEDPFIAKITQRALPITNEGFFELRYLGNRTTVLATLSKSDMQRLVPQEEYGGDLAGGFTDGPGGIGTGTFLNANFNFKELNSATGGNDDDVCEADEQCVIVPEDDSIYLLNFEITAKGGLLEGSLQKIGDKYGATPCTEQANCTPEQKMGAMLTMSPANLPITNIPYLGAAYSAGIAIADGFSSVISFFADLFGFSCGGACNLGAELDRVIREGIRDTYSLASVNTKIVSKEFVQEAVVRQIMYVANSDNAKKTLVLCEEGSAASNGTVICDNPGGLRKGAPGNQVLPKDPPTQLGNVGDYRDPTKYVGTRIALPIFMGDAMADMNTLFVNTYKSYLDYKKGTMPPVQYRQNGTSYASRYSYLDSVLADGKILNRENKEIKTEIMLNEKSTTPDPGVGEFYQRLPVTIAGTAYDGFALATSSYAGADSLTEDAILIWISDRGAYYGGCLPNASNIYWERCRDGLAEDEKPWLRPATGGLNDFFGAGMYMGNMSEAPKLTMDFFMSATQVRGTIETAVDYQYKDKTLDLIFFELDLNSLTKSLTEYFYDTTSDLTFSLDGIDVGLTREQMAAATKQSFNGYLDNDPTKPIVDPGDFQAVNASSLYYCDPLSANFPSSCTNFRSPNDQLTNEERIWKARAQKPLRRISDTLFDNSKGKPNFYLNQLKLRTLGRCKYDTAGNTTTTMVAPFSLSTNFVTVKSVPVLFYQYQGGAAVKSGFYLDKELTQNVCDIAGNCIKAEMVEGSSTTSCQVPNVAGTALINEPDTGLVAKYSAYLDSNQYLIANNFTKKVYVQAENGKKYEIEIPESTDPDKVRAKWKVVVEE